MVTASLLATPNTARAETFRDVGGLPVCLYSVGRDDLPGVGHPLPRQFKVLARPISPLKWDFLSIALAVFGADRFVLRDNGSDRWTRIIQLRVEVVDPKPWRNVVQEFEAALRFLTGDIWQLEFRGGGPAMPKFQPKTTDRDCVCLFSGGLDSLIGALDLIQAGKRPLLVSQATPKEGNVQDLLATKLGMAEHRFAGKVTERGRIHEPSQRARSILFFAYGVLAASGITDEVIVPENGLISINPPLTRRRIGSLSTRTTHPHFLASLQKVFDGVGIDAKLVNPYAMHTKGEMLKACGDTRIKQLAKLSYSCGKGKRLNGQCGVCIPCLIRRASFKAAGLNDDTQYEEPSLRKKATNDDVLAARFAAEQTKNRNMDQWAAEAGPLSTDPVLRAQQVDVVRRGLEELANYITGQKWR